jgi:Flp pilus assembly secretin CpaC/Flp pilus assembly protein TadD
MPLPFLQKKSMKLLNTAPRPQPLSSVAVLLLALTTLGMTGCATMDGMGSNSNTNPLAASQPDTHLFDAIPKDKLNTASRQLAAEGLKALDAKDYRKASDIFNLAVKTDMTNSYLHFLNAVAYQMRGMTGESGLLPLAEQGYQMAVQFDNSNWLARYYAGLLAMNQRNWSAAQSKLVEAAIYAGKQPDLLYDLAVASYYNHDPKTAAAALAGLRELQGGKADDPRVLRASAIVAAALDQKADAQNFLDQLRAATHNKKDVASAAERIDSWSATYQRSGFIKTQFPGGDGGGFPQATDDQSQDQLVYPVQNETAEQSNDAAASADFVEKQMVVVDVVILSTEEDNTHSMGVNLLDGLKLQFGNSSTLTPGYSDTGTYSRDLITPANSTATSVVTRQINMPAVTYSLNIANANAKRNEVLARPTLVALGNQTSNFFSGVDVNAAAVSNGQGSAVQIQKEVGVKLAVTPEFLPRSLIKLNIAAERTFLAIPSTSVKFDFRLDTTKTTVNANVVMKFGETLILSGLSERDQSRDRDGVPVLQDIPIVQYLFSRNVTRDYYKSVLILLTPRRAQYTNRSQEDVAADRANLSPSDLALAEFEDKYRPWFKPIPNVGEIVHKLERSSLFREFQTGDLGGSWQRITDHGERLKTAMGFLFY